MKYKLFKCEFQYHLINPVLVNDIIENTQRLYIQGGDLVKVEGITKNMTNCKK